MLFQVSMNDLECDRVNTLLMHHLPYTSNTR